MTESAAVCLLDDLGVLRIGGADAGKFLQGQLSNDLTHLRADRVLRAGLHNPQGRTLALLSMVTAGDGSVLALLPRELLADIASLLKRYVLRSKVTLSDDSDLFRLYGLVATAIDPPADAGQLVRYGTGDDRRLLLQPLSATPLAVSAAREHWRLLDVGAGLPQVGRASSGQFVAQMLNLDCIDAISFDKGCYTGQEIIARAHYRGRVKRRMQRFVTDAARSTQDGLRTGDTGRLNDGRNYQVVEAARRQDGRWEFLAVAHLPTATADAEPAGAPAGGGATLTAESLPLPYPLPD